MVTSLEKQAENKIDANQAKALIREKLKLVARLVVSVDVVCELVTIIVYNVPEWTGAERDAKEQDANMVTP